MLIYLGADHRGFALKEKIQKFLEKEKFSVIDAGALKYKKTDDYADFAKKVAKRVVKNSEDRGILLCGSGVGMDIAANKVKGIRAALVSSPKQAELSRKDDDSNVLVLAADFISAKKAQGVVVSWLKTPFSGASRYRRRLRKISGIES